MQDIIEVIVKERIYRELESQGRDTLEYLVQVDDSNVEGGTHTGRVLHLTTVHGPVSCGSFWALVTIGEDFPEAGPAELSLTSDQIPDGRGDFDAAFLDALKEAWDFPQ